VIRKKTPMKAGPAAELGCEVCGRLPEPPKHRLTLASIAAMVPLELIVNTLAVKADLPFAVKILVLTLATSLLGIWVAEPSVRRLLRGWLHAPALRRRRRLADAPALWRARTYLADEPGALQHVTRALARQGINILRIHVHRLQDGVLDELILSAPDGLTEKRLLAALQDGGGRDARVWPTTALALADGQTRALTLAAHIAANTDELPLTVAELLGATVLPAGPQRSGKATAEVPGTVLKIPSSRGPLYFSRPAEPFTPAESARAHRLAELTEVVELTALAKERPTAEVGT
jgi:hypothetical protein